MVLMSVTVVLNCRDSGAETPCSRGWVSEICTHRLITRGAAVESILPQVKGLSEVQFYSLMEEILTRPENAAEIERLLKGGN